MMIGETLRLLEMHTGMHYACITPGLVRPRLKGRGDNRIHDFRYYHLTTPNYSSAPKWLGSPQPQTTFPAQQSRHHQAT
jgi:hypothetical protein